MLFAFSSTATLPSWRGSLGRGGDHWDDGRWYNLLLERRMLQAVGLSDQLKAMERAGFTDVDCA